MMQSAERINTLRSLVTASSAEDQVRRRRLGACAALTLLISGLLTAIGLVLIVVAVAAIVLAVVCGTAAARAVRAHWPQVRLSVRRIAGAMLRGSAFALTRVRTGLTHVGGVASTGAKWVRIRGVVLARSGTEHASRRRRQLATATQAKLTLARERAAARMVERTEAPDVQAIDLHREALRLNEAGTRQRRNGAHAEAIDLHRRALEILGELEDRRGVALTQNNLALALSHVGDDRSAIALFEEAAATLSELGEEEHEGQIMANLGLAHRRRGRYEQSENVLQLALTKLTPASRAYATVEAELRRAS